MAGQPPHLVRRPPPAAVRVHAGGRARMPVHLLLRQASDACARERRSQCRDAVDACHTTASRGRPSITSRSRGTWSGRAASPSGSARGRSSGSAIPARRRERAWSRWRSGRSHGSSSQVPACAAAPDPTTRWRKRFVAPDQWFAHDRRERGRHRSLVEDHMAEVDHHQVRRTVPCAATASALTVWRRVSVVVVFLTRRRLIESERVESRQAIRSRASDPSEPPAASHQRAERPR